MLYVATIPRNVSRSMGGMACLAFLLKETKPVGKIGLRFSSETEKDFSVWFNIDPGQYQLRVKFQDKTEFITRLYLVDVTTQSDLDRSNDTIEADYEWWLKL